MREGTWHTLRCSAFTQEDLDKLIMEVSQTGWELVTVMHTPDTRTTAPLGGGCSWHAYLKKFEGY
jgi:hypothetical protein